MKTHFLRLLDYERWTNAQLVASIESLETPPERALSLMSHVLNAQMVWFTRVANDHLVVGVWDVLPVAWLSETLEHSYQKWSSFVKDTDEADFDKIITYQTTTGATFQSSLGDILTHLSHHAAYHRGQIISILKPELSQVPSTDFILWARQS